MAKRGKYATDQPDPLPPGAMNSEHESDTAGMRGSARIENPGHEEQVAREKSPAVRADPGRELDEQRGGPVHRVAATSDSDVDREIKKRGRMTARTAHDMSQHDAMSRIPRRKTNPEKPTGPKEREKE